MRIQAIIYLQQSVLRSARDTECGVKRCDILGGDLKVIKPVETCSNTLIILLLQTLHFFAADDGIE